MTTLPASTQYTVPELLSALAALNLNITRNTAGQTVITSASIAALTTALAAASISTADASADAGPYTCVACRISVPAVASPSPSAATAPGTAAATPVLTPSTAPAIVPAGPAPIPAPAPPVSTFVAPAPTPAPAPTAPTAVVPAPAPATVIPTPASAAAPIPPVGQATPPAAGPVPFIATRLTHSPGAGNTYYAITVGRQIGVFIGAHNMSLTSGVRGGSGRGFKDYDHALDYFNTAYQSGTAYVPA